MKISKNIVNEFISICGQNNVYLDIEKRRKYSKDKTNISCTPELVLVPSSVNKVSEIMTLCSTHKIPITAMGRATGLSAGAVAIHQAIVLSMEEFNKIIYLDENNYQIIVEPYVLNYEIQKLVKEKNLFYPPDPASYRISSIGGNIAENAGGPKALKYGTTKDYVLNLEVVLPNGEIINTGANVLKNVSGYNLTQLLVGSEGTLGIITKASLRLIPLPRYDTLMLVSFKSLEDACRSVNTILNSGILPSCLEIIEKTALLYSQEYSQKIPPLPITSLTKAHLLVELDGNDINALEFQMKQIKKLIENNYDTEGLLVANNEKEKENIWILRRNVYLGMHKHNVVNEMDIVVPRFSMARAIEKIALIAEKYGYKTTAYGHAGDGNLHIGIINEHNIEMSIIELGIHESFEYIIKELGGTISGEHGIGLSQKKYMNIAFTEIELDLMKKIKACFDPYNILNPSKIFP